MTNINDFHCGLFITDNHRVVLTVNRYVESELGISSEALIGKSIRGIFSKSSVLFFESYLLPILQIEKSCKELQLTIKNISGQTIPVTVNAVVSGDRIFWSFFTAVSRNELHEKLTEAKEKIEKQAIHLQQISMTDELTGLPNRRAFLSKSENLISLSKRHNLPYGLFVIDIDHFKKINDLYGHDEGDNVLEQMGEAFKTFGRKQDLLARYGGEEFLLLVAECNTGTAEKLANQLHKLANRIKVGNQKIELSIGVRLGTESFNEAFKQADSALYKAKSSGRNTTVIVKER